MTAPIVLRDDQWSVRILPQIGGSLDECVFRGQTILQPVPQPSRWSPAPVELCYFPLVPFSNRIKNSRFSFDGRTIRLRPNLPGHPHAIHGHGWQSEWRVLQANAAQCTLCFEHAPSDHWPWSYRVLQTFAIDATTLAITLTLTNRGAASMPAGLGFHPFFPRPAAARLLAAAGRLWDGHAEEFPSRSVDIPPDLDFGRARPVRDARGIDHCYSGWSRHAAIEWPGAPYRIVLDAGERLGHLLLYVPEDRDFFCVEPVSHAINAFNYPASDEHAALWLAPDQELSAALTVRCERSRENEAGLTAIASDTPAP
jgi:aldose 1-epimerase